jgi:hypothetical protein
MFLYVGLCPYNGNIIFPGFENTAMMITDMIFDEANRRMQREKYNCR